MYNLLIADDEQLERQAIRFIVEKNCPEINIVGATGDGASAVAIATDVRPDIMLMDIRMPELDGLEATKQIRDLLPDVQVIILTAFDEFSYAKQAVTLGAADYLLKPTRPDDLVKVLRKVCNRIDLMRSQREEEAQLRKSLEEAIPFIKMSFVYDLITGSIDNADHLKDRARFLGMSAAPCVALVVDIDNFKQITLYESELKKQLVKQAVYKQVQSCVTDTTLVTPFGGDSLVVLLGNKEWSDAVLMKDHVYKAAENIRNIVRDAAGVSVSIGIGRFYPDPLDIHKSYLEATQALQHRFFMGSGQIIHYEDLPLSKQGTMRYPVHFEKNVLEKVRCGDRKAAKEALHFLLEEIFAGSGSIENVKACILELVVLLSRAAVDGGANLDRLAVLNFETISALKDCPDKLTVYRWIMSLVDTFFDDMIENRDSTNVRVINKACEYIVTNCHRNLSLEEVAHSVHLSAYYFSRLFKHEKGTNFIDFLTGVRMDKARKLLRNPDNTVQLIARETGYQDASYFSRVFRQAVGVTPNQYRTQMLMAAAPPPGQTEAKKS